MKLLVGYFLLAAFVSAGVARIGPLIEGPSLSGVQAEDRTFRFSRRQLTNLPAECKAICDPVIRALSTCTPTTCCTSTFETAYFGCFLCIGGTATTGDYAAPQSALDAFVRGCASSGIQVPKLTFPGQDPDRPLSGLPGNSTSITTPSSPSTGVNSATSRSPSLTITTDIGTPSPQQITITSLPTTTGPNASPDPTDTAFTPPNNSGLMTMSGQWWAGMTILTVGSLLGGFSIF